MYVTAQRIKRTVYEWGKTKKYDGKSCKEYKDLVKNIKKDFWNYTCFYVYETSIDIFLVCFGWPVFIILLPIWGFFYCLKMYMLKVANRAAENIKDVEDILK